MALSTLPSTIGAQSALASFAQVPLQFSGEFLHYAVVFFVIALLAAVLGARGVAGLSMAIAKWFVIIFLVLAVISVLL